MSKKKLSAKERKLFTACESTLQRYGHAFLSVGCALRDIRDQALYRETHPIFESYLDERWDMSRSRAYRLIDAAGVVDDLSPMGDILPANERQARPLTPLNASERVEVWKTIIARAAGGRITAALVTEVVDEFRDETGQPGGEQHKPDDVFGRITDIKRKLKKMEVKPEYAKFCQRMEARLRKVVEEVEQTYNAAMKDYLGE